MSGESVLNRFEQPGEDRDNKLVLEGTAITGGDQSIKTVLVSVPIGDVSTAGNVYVAPDMAGKIVKITNVIDAAITSADATIDFEIGAVAITGSTITIDHASSAPGTIDASTPTGANIIAVGDSIHIVKNGESSTASNGVIVIEVELS